MEARLRRLETMKAINGMRMRKAFLSVLLCFTVYLSLAVALSDSGLRWSLVG